MKRPLIESPAFISAARKLVGKNPQLARDIQETLFLLSEDAYQARLKTHKLKGILRGSLACSVSYDLRIVFKIINYSQTEAILLETIGTHNEVY